MKIPEAVRFTLMALSFIFLVAGGYHRVQSQRSGETLDRTREGWPLLLGIRITGLLTLGFTALWLWMPAWFEWASQPVAREVRWAGVAGFACAVAWLIWMFRTLGRNLTDTVVTRRDAYFVDYGPYRFVRNPMYTGVLMLGMSLGLALGTWLIPLSAGLMFVLFAARTRREEGYLVDRFGDRYRDYRERVGRFFPKLPLSH
jgi:protein-S-isoprenylcysteine O-methyltransferase Ste14